MQIAELPNGDPVHRYQKCIVVPFTGKRRVLSTSPLNGGYREDLTGVFNNDMSQGPGMPCRMLAPTYQGHLRETAAALGLDPLTSTGISTSASMENVSIKTEVSGKTAVTALVTGGVDENGGRAGDPASWDEGAQQGEEQKGGTINILLFIHTDLTPGTLARALITCTEAKTAALQELMAPSRYSAGLATGSGTDGVILVCNGDSDLCLTDAGQHSRLGELIGRAVKEAVKEALRLQTGLSGESQHQVLRRIDRFGITEQSLWEAYEKKQGPLCRPDFSDRLYRLCQRGELVTGVSLYVHLLDQLSFGLLLPEEALEAGRKLLEELGNRGSGQKAAPEDSGETLEKMLRDLQDALLKLL